MIERSSPIIVGCTGGSGSRLLQQVISNSGIFMGVRLNNSLDAIDFAPFFDSMINPILSYARSVNYSTEGLPSELTDCCMVHLDSIIENYINDIPVNASMWGWKCPRNIYILPFIYSLCPDMRFIHLVRDGRDISISDNQNQALMYYQNYFDVAATELDPVCSIRLWDKVNLDAATWGENTLKERYYRVKFEDICADPKYFIHDIAEFLGQKWDDETLAALVNPADTLGRYIKLSDQERLQLEEAAGSALGRFGYLG